MLNSRFPLPAILASGLVALSGCATTMSPSVNDVASLPAKENVPALAAENPPVVPEARTAIIPPEEGRRHSRSLELAQLRNVWRHAMRVDRRMAVKCISTLSMSKTSAATDSGASSGNWVYRDGGYVRQPSRAPSKRNSVTAGPNHRACVDLSAALSRQSKRMMALSAPGAVNHYLLDAKAWAMDCATFGLRDRECSGDTVLSVLRIEKADASASLNLADNREKP